MVGTHMSSSFAQTMRIASAEIFTFVLLPVSSWPSIQQEDQKDSYANFWNYFSAIFPAKASHLSLPQLLNIFLLNSVRPLLWLGPLTVLWSRNAYRQNAKENVGSTSFVSPLSGITVLHCWCLIFTNNYFVYFFWFSYCLWWNLAPVTLMCRSKSSEYVL